VVIVCLIVAMAIFASIMKRVVLQREMIDRQAWQLQAAWLAESGLERAAWRLSEDPDYSGETWNVPAEALSGPAVAVIEISVHALPEQPRRRLVEIQADYPDDPQHRCRASKQTVVQLPSSEVPSS
jgi:hypothetical protein